MTLKEKAIVISIRFRTERAALVVVEEHEPIPSREEAQRLADSFGYPVILKAAAGGGGRGMRRCDNAEEVGVNFDLVKAEAKKAFGNDDIFMARRSPAAQSSAVRAEPSEKVTPLRSAKVHVRAAASQLPPVHSLG